MIWNITLSMRRWREVSDFATRKFRFTLGIFQVEKKIMEQWYYYERIALLRPVNSAKGKSIVSHLQATSHEAISSNHKDILPMM